MKLSTKLRAMTAFLFWCFSPLHGQDLDQIVKKKMDVVFGQLDKSKIETGLLADYGCLLVKPYAYDGTLADTNFVSSKIWKGLYLSMYTTRINEKATLKEPELILSVIK